MRSRLQLDVLPTRADLQHRFATTRRPSQLHVPAALARQKRVASTEAELQSLRTKMMMMMMMKLHYPQIQHLGIEENVTS
jgi:hypothetical protein